MPGNHIDSPEPLTCRMARLRIEHLWLSLPVVFVVWVGFLRQLPLLDFWWHLKVGEILVTSRSIPRTDLFSFTAAGQPFVLQNWLAEILYYVVYRMGGLPLLVALNTALLVAALVPVYHLCWEATHHLRLSVFCAFLVNLSLFIFGNTRPQVFSFACFAVFYWVLTGYRHQQRDFLWTLPPLIALWANLHGAFVVGLGLIGLFLGCETVRRLARGPQSDTLSLPELRKLGLILVLTALATLVNPETYRVYTYVWTVLRDPGSQLRVVEWQAPPINQLEGVLIFHGPFFLALLVLLSARSRLVLTELALFVGFAILALTARRNGIWFVLIAAPLVARSLPTLDGSGVLRGLRRFRYIEALAWRVEYWKEAPVPPRYGLNVLIASLMLVVTVLVSPWVRPHLSAERLGNRLWEAQTPVGAMDYIEQQGLRGNIFHPQIYGDYLIWRLWPQQRSFVDGRTHVFAWSLIQDYLLTFEDRHWQERVARYDIRYLLLSKDTQASRVIDDARASPDWQVLYEDEVSILFEKVQR